MAATIQAILTSGLSVVETFSQAVNGQNTTTFAPLSETVVLNANTTPPASQHATFSQALAAGAGAIDLTNMPGITAGEVINGTGLKVQLLKLQNPSTNANAITITPPATNPYLLFGTGFSITLQPGQSVEFNGNAATPVIGAAAKALTLAGTGTQALNVHVVLG